MTAPTPNAERALSMLSSIAYFVEHEALLWEVLDGVVDSVRPEPGDTPAAIFASIASAVRRDPDRAATIAALAVMRLNGIGPCPEPAPVDHSGCDNGGKQVRCDRCGTKYVCTPASDFYCTPEGDHCCEPCLMRGMGTTEMHAYQVESSPDGVVLRPVDDVPPNAGSAS